MPQVLFTSFGKMTFFVELEGVEFSQQKQLYPKFALIITILGVCGRLSNVGCLSKDRMLCLLRTVLRL